MMRWFRTGLLCACLVALPVETNAQSGAHRRNEVALDIGYVAGGLSFARRVGESRWSIGAGLWGAWEPPNTFDRDVLEPLGVVVFGRYQPLPWLHADVGLTGARYQWADDRSDCSGTFVGVRTAILAGHRFIFIGPEVSAGVVNDDLHGSDFGAIWGAQRRLVFRCGR
jgi:hypothetical protein